MAKLLQPFKMLILVSLLAICLANYATTNPSYSDCKEHIESALRDFSTTVYQAGDQQQHTEETGNPCPGAGVYSGGPYYSHCPGIYEQQRQPETTYGQQHVPYQSGQQYAYPQQQQQQFQPPPPPPQYAPVYPSQQPVHPQYGQPHPQYSYPQAAQQPSYQQPQPQYFYQQAGPQPTPHQPPPQDYYQQQQQESTPHHPPAHDYYQQQQQESTPHHPPAHDYYQQQQQEPTPQHPPPQDYYQQRQQEPTPQHPPAHDYYQPQQQEPRTPDQRPREVPHPPPPESEKYREYQPPPKQEPQQAHQAPRPEPRRAHEVPQPQQQPSYPPEKKRFVPDPVLPRSVTKRRLGFFDSFIDIIFGVTDQPRDPKFAQPWTTHPEFRKKLKGEKEVKEIKKVYESGIVSNFVNKIVYSIFGHTPVERDAKWIQPWQTHKEHARKREQSNSPRPTQPKQTFIHLSFMNTFIASIFGKPPETRDPKWATPWTTHPEHKRKPSSQSTKDEVPIRKPVVQSSGGLINAIVSLVFEIPKGERDPRWAQPWQTHPEHKRTAAVQAPSETKKVDVESGIIGNTFNKLIYSLFGKPTGPRESKWMEPWQTHPEHKRAPKEHDKLPVKKQEGIFGLTFMNRVVQLIFGKSIGSRDPKWAQPWQTHKLPPGMQLPPAPQAPDGARGLPYKPPTPSGPAYVVPEPAPRPQPSVPAYIPPQPAPSPASHVSPPAAGEVPRPVTPARPPPKEDTFPPSTEAKKRPETAGERKEPVKEKKPTEAGRPTQKVVKAATKDQKKTKSESGKTGLSAGEAHLSGDEEGQKTAKPQKDQKKPPALPADRMADTPKAPVKQVLEEVTTQDRPTKRETIYYEDDEQIIVLPSTLRSRDHIDSILGLDDTSTQVSTRTAPIIETTLRDLKKIYEVAVKPLEVTYKYQDISNRHLSDAELFGTPLILLLGPYSTGKSTFINYILGTEFTNRALKTGTPPSHGAFRIIQFGENDRDLDGTDLTGHWSFGSLQKFGQNFVDQVRGKALRVPLLKKATFVEAPGILEMRRPGERLYPFNDVVQWFIDRADLILVMFDYTKLDAGYEMEAILDQLKGRESQTRILLNKADQVPPEELIKVQGSLFWNLSPLLGISAPPVVYAGSFASHPYRPTSPGKLFQAQEEALLHDIAKSMNARVDNRIGITRRHAVRVRNHAQMVDTYLRTFYSNKGFLTSKHKLAEDIVENPHDYNIYEGMSLLTNISRYDLPDAEVYRDFFRIHHLYDFRTLRETCSFISGCPLDKIDSAISKQLPELMERHRRMVEAAFPAARLSDPTLRGGAGMRQGGVHIHTNKL